MIEVLRWIVLVAATVTTGLLAGLFYTFAMAVMPGLARVDDRSFVAAMQRINEAILNGWFAISFAGAPLLTLVAAGLHLPAGERAPLPWIIAGFAGYAVMFVITMRINVPLNNELLNAGPVDRIADPGQARRRFETRWLPWNVVRAVVSTAGFVCLVVALVVA